MSIDICFETSEYLRVEPQLEVTYLCRKVPLYGLFRPIAQSLGVGFTIVGNVCLLLWNELVTLPSSFTCSGFNSELDIGKYI